ncbi:MULTISPECIES: hypothetical protein [Kitasatospora]|uniref:hypothetical protein n=1 Tax=Kitasatospora TaxID=2063 RepID=UPI0004BED882|nr:MULTISPECIES: hypothetical protein [Kitasatospora]
MPFDVFSAIGAMVRAEATRTTESAPSDPATTAHPAEPQPAPHPLQEPAAGPAVEPAAQPGALPPAAPLLPGLST